MAKKKLFEDIKSRPPRFYRMPADVLRDRRFCDAERLEILRTWMAAAEDPAILRQLETMVETLESRDASHRAAE